VSKCPKSASASGSALGFAIPKVLIISNSETGRYRLSVCEAPTALAEALVGPEENMDF
jgi:hypothetical protein